MIVFVDTEVSASAKKVRDYGAVREDGAVLHTKSVAEFKSFIERCDEVCGHNLFGFDLKYTPLEGNHTVIDTLFLSPLLFPRKPYHRLVKDDKLQADELNNPVNDAKKARDLYFDEKAAWESLTPNCQAIFYKLLCNVREFEGFMRKMHNSPVSTDKRVGDLQGNNRMPHDNPVSTDKRVGDLSETDRFAQKSQNSQNSFDDRPVDVLIAEEYSRRICSHANVAAVARKYPVELAYALAVIGTNDIQSITPAWVLHNYPKVSNVLFFLLNKPCGDDGCTFCRERLDAHHGLRDFFGYEHFREFDGEPMQQQAVEAAIRGESLLTIFPTGGGKSLTFQLPALMAGRNMHGLTVVISPLLSLMKDQVDSLDERGITAAVAINGLLDPIERASAISQVADGTANLMYIAPEMLRSSTVEKLLMSRTVVRFVIDEAHCFSAWGQDFRVDYLYIGDFIRGLQEKKQSSEPIAVSCFTATAKQKVVADIRDYFRKKLGLELKLFAADATRKNLRYTVIHANTHEEKYTTLRNLIVAHNCPTIVYVARTKRTAELAYHLCSDGISAMPFNGKMDAKDKIASQEAFMSGAVRVVVATSAFGMGVDKKDVGLVVHYDVSDSLENYMQEAGRAGRDPAKEADCYILYGENDLDKHFLLLNQTKLSISDIQQVWKVVKDMTLRSDTFSCSPLEIARNAGWVDDNGAEMETRVRAAVAALEDAGFIERGNNSPHVFATGITVDSVIEARRKLALSPLFDEKSREEAVRILKSLISRRVGSNIDDGQAESRVDYLADILGMSRDTVIRNVNLMRQEGLLADSIDMQTWVSRDIGSKVDAMLQLERFLLAQFRDQAAEYNYKQLNEEASRAGMKGCSVGKLRKLVHFLALREYVRKEEHTALDSVSVQLQTSADVAMARFERRVSLCRFVAHELSAMANKDGLAVYSEVALLTKYNSQGALFDKPATLFEMDETLLYLTKSDIVRSEGGFLVVYNTMRLRRVVERRARYGKEQYRLLDEFYQQRIQQIHIVGEYANLMVRDYDAAMLFVRDYFSMDYRVFIAKYFKGYRRAEIGVNISPAMYRKLFGELSQRQMEIVNDKQSKCIVVAAGPGSGKTRVLVHKLASLLLLEDVKHEQLLMLTFSRAAATEFKKRLISLVGNAAHLVDIKTFHSYSFDLLGRLGSLEESAGVVSRAAQMIEDGEVETAKIAKTVLVIDEAQDMSDDDFRLVCALMQRNEDMRVIAVGDDDQNIYHFRGSDSRHFASLVADHGATYYEMTENYRSDCAIVSCANRYARQIPNRMKQSPIVARSRDNGFVVSDSEPWNPVSIELAKGSTGILTATNEQALQVAYQLQCKGLHVRLVQDDGGFRFVNLAEVRYFFKQLGDDVIVTRQQWNDAKRRTLATYDTSAILPAMQRFFDEYESSHKQFYRSDLREFALESKIDDFLSIDDNDVFVSTIHKAKGREFDTVHLLVDGIHDMDEEKMRVKYVGMTRARHGLYIHSKSGISERTLVLSLSMRDVWLDFFRDRKEAVLRLRSGEALNYSNGYLSNTSGEPVACLSNSKREYVLSLQKRGYRVVRAEVSYVLAWRPREEPVEIAVCLAKLYLDTQS